MNRLSFIKSLALGSACIMIPRVTKPIWGKNRIRIQQQKFIHAIPREYPQIMTAQWDGVTSYSQMVTDTVSKDQMKAIFDDLDTEEHALTLHDKLMKHSADTLKDGEYQIVNVTPDSFQIAPFENGDAITVSGEGWLNV